MPTRSELHKEATEARAIFALTSGNEVAKRRYLGTGLKLYDNLFGEAIDGPNRANKHQIFVNYDNASSLDCTHAVVAIAGCDDFPVETARKLISHVRGGRDEAAVSLLEDIGLTRATALCRLKPLKLILI